MRLRNKMATAMAAATLTGVALTGLLTWYRIDRTIREESEREISDASVGLLGEWRALGSDITGKLAQVTQKRNLRTSLGRLAQGMIPAGSDEILNLGPRVLVGSGLDFFQIFDESGKVLTNGQQRVSYGGPDPAGWEIVRRNGPEPAAHRRSVKGQSFLALETAATIEFGDHDYFCVGGRAVTPEVVDDLTRRTGGALYIELRDGTRVLPTGVAPQDLRHLEGAVRQETGGFSFIVARPAGVEAAKLSLVPIKGPDGTVLGDFVLRISQVRLVNLAGELSFAFIGVAAIGLILAWAVGFWFARRITRPVEQLARAARRVGIGRAPGAMPPVTDDEVGDLVRSFRRMTDDLSESRRELVRAERLAAWREIAQRMAHEIKNALSPIQISVETIQRSHRSNHPDLPEIVDESVNTVREEVRGLRNLVNEFSQFARTPELKLAPGNVRPVIERVAALHARNHGDVRVSTAIPDALPDVSHDPEALARAIGNIVLNAVEASPDGSSVTVAAAPIEGGGVEILIDDSGHGVPAAERERIFEPYVTTKPGGTGLGLAMVWKIVSEHDGRVEILDAPGGGARFRVVLPAVDPEAAGSLASREGSG